MYYVVVYILIIVVLSCTLLSQFAQDIFLLRETNKDND